MTDQSIYLVRHGETAFNADGRLRGLADPDLNAAGLGQATRLAESIYSNYAVSVLRVVAGLISLAVTTV